LKFNFKKREYELQKAYYNNYHVALVACGYGAGAVQYFLTVDLPSFDFPENEFAIKTWGKNKDIVEVVFNLNIFEDTGKRGGSGESIIEFWKLLNNNMLMRIPFANT